MSRLLLSPFVCAALWLVGLSACVAAAPPASAPALQLTDVSAHAGASLIPVLRPGDVIRLRAEPDHPFDPDAVAAYWGRFKMGYLPSGAVQQLACPPQCLDDDDPPLARVVAVQGEVVTVDLVMPNWSLARR